MISSLPACPICAPSQTVKNGRIHNGKQGETQKKGRLTIRCDELWSFVDNKGNKQWVWLALDADTREIVGVYIGARDEAAAQKLWQSLPQATNNEFQDWLCNYQPSIE